MVDRARCDESVNRKPADGKPAGTDLVGGAGRPLAWAGRPPVGGAGRPPESRKGRSRPPTSGCLVGGAGNCAPALGTVGPIRDPALCGGRSRGSSRSTAPYLGCAATGHPPFPVESEIGASGRAGIVASPSTGIFFLRGMARCSSAAAAFTATPPPPGALDASRASPPSDRPPSREASWASAHASLARRAARSVALRAPCCSGVASAKALSGFAAPHAAHDRAVIGVTAEHSRLEHTQARTCGGASFPRRPSRHARPGLSSLLLESLSPPGAETAQVGACASVTGP